MIKSFTAIMFSITAMAIFLYMGASAESPLLALNKPVKKQGEKISVKLQEGTTEHQKVNAGNGTIVGRTDFDEFNNINDPLSRSGSREQLKKAVKVNKAKNMPMDFRDAPAERLQKMVPQKGLPVAPLKRGPGKLRPADPVQTKPTL